MILRWGRPFKAVVNESCPPDSSAEALTPLSEYDWTRRWTLKGEHVTVKLLRRPPIQSDCVPVRRECLRQQGMPGLFPEGRHTEHATVCKARGEASGGTMCRDIGAWVSCFQACGATNFYCFTPLLPPIPVCPIIMATVRN